MEKEKKETSKKDKKVNPQEEKIIGLEKQLEDFKNDYLRLAADFDNYRKRKEKETLDARDNAVIDFVLEILPSIDNFEMSLKMSDNKEMFIKGVEMIHKNLIDSLKQHHFEQFEVKENQHFDPYMHEPILIEDKSRKSGTIVKTLKKGYKHKQKIVRPAIVQVVKEEEKNKE